jgi:hypothetical protein
MFDTKYDAGSDALAGRVGVRLHCAPMQVGRNKKEYYSIGFAGEERSQMQVGRYST